MLVSAALRFLQILFSIVALSLSLVLIKQQVLDSPPSQTYYAAFCGGWGLLVALIGIAALFIEGLNGIIMAGLDAVTSILVAAGGIALAVALGTTSCSDIIYLLSNPIIRGGGWFDGSPLADTRLDLSGRCSQAKADDAFLFFASAAFMAAAVLGVLGRSGNGRTSFV